MCKITNKDVNVFVHLGIWSKKKQYGNDKFSGKLNLLILSLIKIEK